MHVQCGARCKEVGRQFQCKFEQRRQPAADDAMSHATPFATSSYDAITSDDQVFRAAMARRLRRRRRRRRRHVRVQRSPEMSSIHHRINRHGFLRHTDKNPNRILSTTAVSVSAVVIMLFIVVHCAHTHTCMTMFAASVLLRVICYTVTLCATLLAVF